MPTPTYTPIASQTTSTTVASVTFSSLSGFRNLVLSCRNITSGTLAIRLNGNSGTYRTIRMTGNGSNANAGTTNNTFWSPAFWCDPGTGFALQMHLFDTNQFGKFKEGICFSDNSGNGTETFALYWQNQEAINSITFYEAGGGTLNAGGTYSLYEVIG